LKTLLAVYTGLLGRAEAVQEKAVLQWVESERKKHKAPVAYWLKKKIITENLFGVDIMEEAVEIAKLRLFLALVASAERREHLEPLPNIEFNLMHGNSLIGLLHVDPKNFDTRIRTNGDQDRMPLVHEPTAKDLGFAVESKTAPTTKEKVGAHLAEKRAKKYDELLREKNRLVDLYRRSALDFEDLTALKQSIESKKADARTILNKLLLDEFRGLGIQFQQAKWDNQAEEEGKPEKRRIQIEDIQALQPFHWAYEFDEIIVNRGGFDVIITNPPWDVFEKSDKEFFLRYEPTIQKNKLRLEDWIEQRDTFLKNRDVREAWLEYLSSYAHQAEWFKAAPQYQNQTTIIDGRVAASKNDFYKLFLEQTVNFLKKDGRCGAVISGGFYNNKGASQIRRMLFETTTVTSLVGFENRKRIFEGVDSRFKFFVLTFRRNGPTTDFHAAFMRHNVSDLATFPAASAVKVDYSSIAKYAPDTLGLIEFRSSVDANIFIKLTRFPPFRPTDADHRFPSLHYELNLTLDNKLFERAPAKGRVRLVEGKVFHQFDDHWENVRYWVRERPARIKLIATRRRALKSVVKEAELELDLDKQKLNLGCDSYRLAFRDVARNTDLRTMIATVLPRGVFCPHTVALERVYEPYVDEGQKLHANNCPLDDKRRCVLAVFFNSFVLDYLVRLQVTAHLSFFYVYNLSLPSIGPNTSVFHQLAERAARLIGTTGDFNDLLKKVFGDKATYESHGVHDERERLKLRAEIDAMVANLYELSEEEFAHILSTFPLVPTDIKTLTLDTFRATLPTADDKAVRALIEGRETDKVELKEGAAYSKQRNQKSPDMIRKVLREVVGFLNSGGGNVFLGVTDAGKVVGIADDIHHADSKKKNRDGYELFLRNSIGGKLGTIHSSNCKISFHKIDNLEVCRIFVPASLAPVYLDGDLIIRDGTSSRQLNAQETSTYISQHSPVPN
jgi:hypothetical protein